MAKRNRNWIRKARIIELTHGAMASLDEFRLHLARVRPDAVHLIGCSHGGVMSYPSQIGPGAEDDSHLRERIEVARSMGIRVIGQHSGVGNTAAGDAHPEWIRTCSDGRPSKQNFAGWQMDLLSPYPEEWFLPQIEEMLRDYEVDGIWVDGDCWYVYPSDSDVALARFKEETGLDAPRIDEGKWALVAPTASGAVTVGAGEPLGPCEVGRVREWMAFTRRVFREFQRKTGELCHRYGATYASNGTHSVDSGPDAVPDYMDYLSHDIPAFEASGSFMASLKARFNDTQGVPHDVMTWDHNSHNPWGGYQTYPKGRKQFFCEVGAALANGAIWDNWTSRPHDAMAWDVADFIHRHKRILSGTESAAEIAVLHSSTSYYVHSGGLFRTQEGNRPVWGASRALQMGGHHYDIVSEHRLPALVERYRLIILAGQTHLPAETVRLLDEFICRGGRLLATGRSGFGDGDSTALADILGLGPRAGEGDQGFVVEARPEWVDEVAKPEGADVCLIALETPRLGVAPQQAEVIQCALSSTGDPSRALRNLTGWQWRSSPMAPDSDRPFLTRNTRGSGEAWYVAADLFGHYEKHHYFGLRHLILDIVDRVLPDPLVRARAERPVEVALRRRGESVLVCHVLNHNMVGMNPAVETQYQRHASTGPVHVELRLPVAPASVRLARTGRTVKSGYETGLLRVTLKDVDVMESLVVRLHKGGA